MIVLCLPWLNVSLSQSQHSWSAADPTAAVITADDLRATGLIRAWSQHTQYYVSYFNATTADTMTADQLKLMTICWEPLSPHCCAVVSLRAQFVSDNPLNPVRFSYFTVAMQRNAQWGCNATLMSRHQRLLTPVCHAELASCVLQGEEEGLNHGRISVQPFLLFKIRELSGSNLDIYNHQRIWIGQPSELMLRGKWDISLVDQTQKLFPSSYLGTTQVG